MSTRHHARLNAVHGLFKVTERVYQVRGFDAANVSFIEGDTGVIVIDPLMVAETAAAARRVPIVAPHGFM